MTCLTTLKKHVDRCQKQQNVNTIKSHANPSTVDKKLHEADRTKIKEKLVQWVASTYSSFLSSENKNLKNLVQFGVEFGYKYGSNIDVDSFWPGRKTVKKFAMEVAEANKSRAKKSISAAKNLSCLSVTSDIWSDGVVRNSYIDITVFFVENFELKHELIAFRLFDEQHTAQNILEKIKDVSIEFGIDHLQVPYITDSGANIKAALKNGEWYACLCHRFHTIVSDTWQNLLDTDPEIKLLWEKMIAVRKSVKMSNDLGAKLPVKLPNDAPTRFWVGLSAFFQAFYASFDEIAILFAERNIEAPTNKRLIAVLSDTLSRFDFVFKGMQAANIPTLHLSILNMAKINSICQDLPPRMQNFSKILMSGMKRKWVSEINTGHILSIALHPNFKSMSIFNSCDIFKNIELPDIETALLCISESIEFEDDEEGECIEKPAKIQRQADDFMDPIEDEEPAQLQGPDILDEYRNFKNEKISTKYEDPLVYWKHSSFKNLKHLAASIYCIPVSSAEPERHNSAAGLTVTPMRSLLAPETVETLVLLNEHYKNC